ncbi:hypothetical protein M2103_002166 [Ereboglobus sp. PH5-5]|uniref:hypothetical protein n=1 Tax=Ereboglobus sp. PH5-5 TaxID=2940529 RepID=UPI00240739A1|nr:hypothetical protein [Ereboglobus sp. PH5-5]MDF9833931.1 hypothetical protein [Ereboglobus sp. PH5-5]
MPNQSQSTSKNQHEPSPSWHETNSLFLTGIHRADGDRFYVLNADNKELLLHTGEPELTSASNALRHAGAIPLTLTSKFGKMAGFQYIINDSLIHRPILKISREPGIKGTCLFHLLAENRILRLEQCFTIVSGDKWRFTDENRSPIAELRIKRKGFLVLSTASLSYDLIVNGAKFASYKPCVLKVCNDREKVPGKLIEFVDTLEPGSTFRLLLLGVAIALERIMQR